MYKKEGTDLKELTNVTVEAGKSQICTAGWRHQEEMMLQFESDGRTPSSSGISGFIVRPLTG